MKSIFVVDNDPAVCTFMSMFLRKHGYSVTTAEDGLEALTLLEGKRPDVVFIDLVMPNISGEKLCQILRSQRRFDDTYCIVLSAISSEEEIDYVLFGFDACIAKGPLNKLGAIVLEVLGYLGTTITRNAPGGIYGLEHLYRREITRELLSTKRHFELILGNMAESIIETSADGRIVFANKTAVELLGVREEVLLSVEFSSLFGRPVRDRVGAMLAHAAAGNAIEPDLVEYGERFLWVQVLPVADEGQTSLVIIIEDVTERREAEEVLRRSHEDLELRVAERTAELAKVNESLRFEIEQRTRLEERLRSSLREKEVLLHEIHHRVKNNLQIISSILGLNANRIANEELAGVVRDMRQRIQSLSLVHDKLYRSEDLGAVQIGDYFRSLVNSLARSYAREGQEIRVRVDVEEIRFPLDFAVPCALIVNELVTNSIKYAFPGGGNGTIGVSLSKLDSGSYRMEVTDDGVGLPDGFGVESSDTLGFKIVKVLAGQIGARLLIGRKAGTRFRFEFSETEEDQPAREEETHGK